LQRVLIIENETLLGAGVQSLLQDEANMEVIGISPSNLAELIQEIRRSRSDVVVLDEVTHLTGPTKLLALLEDYPKLRLVVVSANDDRVRIYDKREVLVTHTTDLLYIFCDSKDFP
jgi:DNA-binding NarL/FixJ family response regulator